MLRISALVCSIFLFALPAEAQHRADQRPIAEIPFEIGYDGLIVIDVSVNGRGGHHFIVDTGATITVVFENLIKQQAEYVPETNTRRVIGISSAELLPTYTIDRMDIGPLNFQNHRSVIVGDWGEDRPTPQGIIGLDVLENYFVHFDIDARVLRLYDSAAPRPTLPGNWASASLKRYSFSENTRHIYIVDVKLKGTAVPMIFDLGAENAIINYKALRRVLATSINSEYEVGGHGVRFGVKFSDLFDETDEAKLVRLKNLVIGKTVWRKPALIVFDGLIFEELGVAKKPFGMLGAKILLARNFALDFQTSEYLIGPETEQSSLQLSL